MRLEGTLNQIRLRCPGQITDHEVPWHLKEWLFHGVQKHVRDSIRHLYGNSETTYSQLVVTACRAESKTEETKDRVKARIATATEVASGSIELGDQIARFMSALTRVDQGSCPASLPNSPRQRVQGTGRPLSTPVPTMVRLACVKLLPFPVPLLQTEKSAELQWRGNIWAQGGSQSTRDSNTLQCFRCQGWGHMAKGVCHSSQNVKQGGGIQGNAVKPPSNNTR